MVLLTHFGNPVVQRFTKTSQAISNLEYPRWPLDIRCHETHTREFRNAPNGDLLVLCTSQGHQEDLLGPRCFGGGSQTQSPEVPRRPSATRPKQIVAIKQGNQFPPQGLSETVGIDDGFCELMILQVLRFYQGGREQKGAWSEENPGLMLICLVVQDCCSCALKIAGFSQHDRPLAAIRRWQLNRNQLNLCTLD